MDYQLDTQMGAQIDEAPHTEMCTEIAQISVQEVMTKSTAMTDANTVKLFDSMSLKKLENALKSAPLPPRKLTKSEALLALVPELKKQLERGHTVASLAVTLEANGLQVGERKISQLLRGQANVSLA